MKQTIKFNTFLKNDFFFILECSFLGKKNLLKKFNIKKKGIIRNIRICIKDNYIKRRHTIVMKYILVKSNLEAQPFFNELKKPLKYERLKVKESYNCKLFFKNSGSNIFVTLTTNKGEVIFSYSAGLFKKLRTRKEKTTLIVAKQIGQVLSVRLYKSNLAKLYFYPEFSSSKTKSRLRSMVFGLGFLRIKYISIIFLKLRITRNGMRLKKSRR